MPFDRDLKELKEFYCDLKRSMIDFSMTSEENHRHLEALKDAWGKDIGSVRQLEMADSLEALIHLLEKRGILGWFDVDPLAQVLLEYDIDGATREEYRAYLDKAQKFKQWNRKAFLKLPYDPDILREIPANSESLPSDIAEVICDGMGSHWRYFARELSDLGAVSEAKCDELHNDTTLTNSQKTQILLDIFFSGDNRTKWSQLRKVLQALNRNDLDEKVDNRFMEYYARNS